MIIIISGAGARGGMGIFSHQYGFADIDLNVPTPANTVYEIGSNTRYFTAAAILQLVDKGFTG
jgi:CubicO group peptidase (beta-lactamase class C family)